MSQAYAAFQKNIESIASLIRGADVYCQLVLAISRSQEPDLGLIKRIISEKGMSTLNYSWQFFMTRQEYEEFDKAEHIRHMCEHIVFASYVALEHYLIGKFHEYSDHVQGRVNDRDSRLRMTRPLRSLDEIKRQFARQLKIRIAAFEPEIGTLDEAEWFCPTSSWNAITILEKARHDLAHHGRIRSHRIVVLVDAWSAFDFVREWVELFETNFNAFIFEGKKYDYVRNCVDVV